MSRSMVIFVCPDCGAYANDIANGYPLHEACEIRGHREAKATEVMPVPEHHAAVADYEAALKVIAGPADTGPWIEVYRAAGGGYEGLQAVAEVALAKHAGD